MTVQTGGQGNDRLVGHKCYKCGRIGSHEWACPDYDGDPIKKRVYDLGWKDGRSGIEALRTGDQTYMLGHCQGECALEEAQNGFDPVHEGRQW